MPQNKQYVAKKPHFGYFHLNPQLLKLYAGTIF